MLVHIKAEGQAAHPDDVYIHCGCSKCDCKFRKQAKAYYEFLSTLGIDINKYKEDRWFPSNLPIAAQGDGSQQMKCQ